MQEIASERTDIKYKKKSPRNCDTIVDVDPYIELKQITHDIFIYSYITNSLPYFFFAVLVIWKFFFINILYSLNRIIHIIS